MALSRLVAAATWFTNQLIDAAAMQSRIIDPTNAVIDALNAKQSAAEAVSIPSGSNSQTGTVTYPTPYATGVQPFPFTQVAHVAGPQTSVTITARTNVGFSYKVFRCDGSNAPGGGTPSNFYWQTDGS
jgi:hypothetical protein